MSRRYYGRIRESFRMRDWLRPLAKNILAFRRLVSEADVDEQTKIESPQEFITAWLHVIAAVACAADDFNDSWDEHRDSAKTLMVTGMTKTIASLSDSSLLGKAAMLPVEVLSVVLLDLLNDQVGKCEDISQTYSQSINVLVRIHNSYYVWHFANLYTY
jgi:hypothetical protein